MNEAPLRGGQNKTFTIQIRMHQSRLERGFDSAQGPPKPSYSPPVDKTWLFLSATFLQSYSPRAGANFGFNSAAASVSCSRNVATVKKKTTTSVHSQPEATCCSNLLPRTSLIRTNSAETPWKFSSPSGVCLLLRVTLGLSRVLVLPLATSLLLLPPFAR